MKFSVISTFAALIITLPVMITPAHAAVTQNGIQQQGTNLSARKQEGPMNGHVLQGAKLNGLTQNGISQNGLHTNGTLPNGLSQNGVVHQGASTQGNMIINPQSSQTNDELRGLTIEHLRAKNGMLVIE